MNMERNKLNLRAGINKIHGLPCVIRSRSPELDQEEIQSEQMFLPNRRQNVGRSRPGKLAKRRTEKRKIKIAVSVVTVYNR